MAGLIESVNAGKRAFYAWLASDLRDGSRHGICVNGGETLA
jgi:hypothetical protein